MADSRFSDLFKKGKPAEEGSVMEMFDEVKPGDETREANSPRNFIANKVNPLLDEYVNPVLPESVQLAIPKQTVADEKQYTQDLPQNIAGGTMGSLKVIPSARFGNIMQRIAPEAESLGKVVAKPSMQELSEQASKIGQKRFLDSQSTMQQLEQRFGQELAKRKADMKQGLISPDAYNTFKQEMINKIRRGE